MNFLHDHDSNHDIFHDIFLIMTRIMTGGLTGDLAVAFLMRFATERRDFIRRR